MWIIDGIITQMTLMFYVIACFLKVDAAGRCIIVLKKKKNFFKKRTAELRSERKAGVTLKKERRPLAEGKACAKALCQERACVD